jgi:1-acyl-sn-glycerol-3-phosphate acyltransferase
VNATRARQAFMWWSVGKGILASATRLAVPLKDYGRERIPREGGVVLAVNHVHWVDIPAIGTLCPRRIVFLAKAEAHEIPGFGQLMRSMGTLSVRRGESDREALRLARQAVRDNQLLGIFVEGTRQLSGRPGEAKAGAAMIAMQEGVPVLPAAVYGSYGWTVRDRGPVSVAWGEPMRFEHLPRNSRGYKEATVEIQAEILRLWSFLVDMHRLGRPDGTPPRRAELPSRTG